MGPSKHGSCGGIQQLWKGIAATSGRLRNDSLNVARIVQVRDRGKPLTYIMVIS